MNEELEALEKICSQARKDRDLAFFLEHKNCKQTEENKKFFPYCNGCLYCSGNENYKIIEKALKEYERLKEDIKKCSCWKEHKALEIIKEKRVDVSYLLCVFENDSKCKNYEGLHAYNSFAYHIDLTEQEYDLLKEVLL